MIFKNMVRFWWLVALVIIAVWYLSPSYDAVILTIYGIFTLLLSRSSVSVKNSHYLFGSQKTLFATYFIVVLGIFHVVRIQLPLWIAALVGWNQQYIIVSP